MKKIILLVCLVVFGYVSVAIASDRKIFPGTFCKEEKDSHPEIIYYYSGAYNDNPTYDSYFLCPIMRSYSVEGNYAKDIRVWVQDMNPTKNVKCRILSTTKYNKVPDHSGWRSSGGMRGAIELVLPDISPVETDGNYTIQCFVPDKTKYGRSGVLSYQLSE